MQSIPERADEVIQGPRVRSSLNSDLLAASVYILSRLILLTLSLAIVLFAHRSIVSQMTVFDGQWYLKLAEFGYPNHVVTSQSTLGFFPLYPLSIRILRSILGVDYAASAVLISITGGFIATLLVRRLAAIWWGERSAFRVTIAFCFFPGSIVFSMAYSDSLLIALAVGCLLALSARRWLAAGVLAGLATAVGPLAVPLIVACLVPAVQEIVDKGWAVGKRSTLAPLISISGISGFAVYLWWRTGTPFAAYLAQRLGWHEQLSPLTALSLKPLRHILSNSHLLVRDIVSWNLLNGVLGAAFFFISLLLLLRVSKTLSRGSLVWTVGVGFVSLLSLMTAVKGPFTFKWGQGR